MFSLRLTLWWWPQINWYWKSCYHGAWTKPLQTMHHANIDGWYHHSRSVSVEVCTVSSIIKFQAT